MKPNASCKIGFWKKLEIRSQELNETVIRPYGKWAWFVTDTNNELTVRAPESIYSGEQDIKEPYKIRVLKCLKNGVKPIKDYKTNVVPTNLQS